MAVGAAPGIGFHQPDGLVHPVPGPAAGDIAYGAHRADTVGCACPVWVSTAGPLVGLATRVSRVASGRQQNRTGAYGDVPMPADTCSFMSAPHCDGPLARERSRSQLVASAP